MNSVEQLDLDTVAGKIKDLTLPADKGFDVSFDEMKNCSYDISIKFIKKADWASLNDAMSRYVIYEYLSSKNELAMNKTPITSVCLSQP